MTEKRTPDEYDVDRRLKWLEFVVDARAYTAFQVAGMTAHLRARPALEAVWLAPHDADGRPVGATVRVTRRAA